MVFGGLEPLAFEGERRGIARAAADQIWGDLVARLNSAGSDVTSVRTCECC
jgi:hypothetical protein